MAAINSFKGITISTLLSTSTVAATVFSALSYDYAYGYMMRIDPRLVSSFSLSDLISIGAIHIGFVVIYVLVSVATITHVPGHFLAFRDTNTDDHYEQFKKRYASALTVTTLLVMVIVIATIYYFAFADARHFGKSFIAMAGQFIITPIFGFFVLLILVIGGAKEYVPYLIILGMLSVTLCVFCVGDYQAIFDEQDRDITLPCGYIRESNECMRVLVLGSNFVLARRKHRTILLARDRFEHFQTEPFEQSVQRGK